MEGILQIRRGTSWGRLIFDQSCDGRAGVIQAGKGRQGHSMQGQPCGQVLRREKQLLGLLGYSSLRTAGRKPGCGGISGERQAGGKAGARSCTIFSAKPGSLNLMLRATGSRGSFQEEEQNCVLKSSFWLPSRNKGLAEQKGEVRRRKLGPG